MRVFFITLSILFNTSIYAQSFESIIEGYFEHVKSLQSFQVTITYNLYKSHSSNEITESMNGLSARNNDKLYAQIGPTEFFLGKDRSIKVSNAQKMMVITNSNVKQDIMSSSFTAEQLSHFTSEKVEDKGTFWSCYLIPNDAKVTPNPMEIHINKRDYSLKKQVVYFSNKMHQTNKDQNKSKENQRLEISFGNYNDLSSDTAQKLSLAHYVKLKESDYIPVGQYKNYDIHATVSNLN